MPAVCRLTANLRPRVNAWAPAAFNECYTTLSRWVQQNIVAFGGDPANVTLFGESAGSIDATTLMASPLTQNLFRRVIAESGPAFGLGPARTVAQMQPLGLAAGKEAAGGKPGSQLQALRSLPAARIAEIEDRLIASQFKNYDPNASIVDGWVLPQSPARAFASGRIEPVDLLVGLNGREFAAFRVDAAAAAKKSPQPAAKPGTSEMPSQFANLARPLYGTWTDMTVATYAARILVHGDPAVDQATGNIWPAGARRSCAIPRTIEQCESQIFDLRQPPKSRGQTRRVRAFSQCLRVFGA